MARRYPRGDTVLFQTSATASAATYLVSGRIGYPFVIDQILVNWVLGTQRLMPIELLWATEDSQPATGRPTGNNAISGLGNARGLCGDGYPTLYPVYERVNVQGAFLKLFANNTDTVAHTVDVMVRLFHLEDVED